MARVSALLLFVIGLAYVVTGEESGQGEDTNNPLYGRCALDIATILEDVKVLLSYSHHGDDALSYKHSPSLGCSSSSSPSCLAQDCRDVREQMGPGTGATASGLATVYLSDPLSPFFQPVATTVYCDQVTAGGDWLLLMRRSDNSENFPDRSFDDYARGFGNVAESSFWLGLESMYRLTSAPGKNAATLRVELEDWDGERRYAQYSYFRVSPGTDGYRMFASGFSGDAGDALGYHSGQRFSTKANDQDSHAINCAERYNGAWWFKGCVTCCLTGEYIDGGAHTDKEHQGVYWRNWRGTFYSYKIAEMKIRFPA